VRAGKERHTRAFEIFVTGLEGPLSNPNPPGAVDREASAGNDTVNVGMQKQGLAPRVKNGQSTDPNMEPAESDLGQCCAGGAEQKIVKQTWFPAGTDVEFLRDGEDYVEVRNGQQLGAASLDPGLTGGTLAAGAAAAAAGMPLNMFKAAALTLLALPTEGRSSTRGNGSQRFPLGNAGRMRTDE
jgi:hypothetical protein